ncbi:AtpZ/AtpI family protein [Planktotalea sp.]|uniref:AtpZ/AtpI family protein n=1 Tax=Planktotalea sp. TaxID=2029877 RepID=UPI003D6B4AD9
MTEPEHHDRLKQLDDKIAKVKATQSGGPASEEHYSQAQQGWRMVTELVAGLGIGFGIGYGLDTLFGTIPIMLVLFTFLGFAAGVKTMMRTAQEIQTKQVAEQADDEQRG